VIVITSSLKERLQSQGVHCLWEHEFSLPENSVFEPPCSLKWMSIASSISMGAFSYAVSGYYFGTSIGRYVSIGEAVQIGRGSHPVSWASTSPVIYGRHEDAIGFVVPEAAGYTPDSPTVLPRQTTIGHDVYIGHGAFIMQGITIGTGAVIGAYSVVTKDVPPYAIVAGNPASLKRMRFSDKIIYRMLASEWWRYAFWDFKSLPVADPEKFLDVVDSVLQSGIAPYSPNLVRLSEIAS
jgi:acetyltransferase-like isoleucine patch superfamily enzyme